MRLNRLAKEGAKSDGRYRYGAGTYKEDSEGKFRYSGAHSGQYDAGAVEDDSDDEYSDEHSVEQMGLFQKLSSSRFNREYNRNDRMLTTAQNTVDIKECDSGKRTMREGNSLPRRQ
jgi:hypothetical protein